MPFYTKFLKEILFKKRRPNDNEIIALTEECNAILQNKLPLKLKDPGNFSIPCLIGNMNIDKVLCDLGASMSLMPLSICQKLNVEELRPTIISLQLADRSVKDGGRCPNSNIILGRPFLATAGAIIDIKNERLTLKVGDEEVEFKLFQAMKQKSELDECLRVDIIDKLVEKEFQKRYPKDPLKACIVHGHTVENENKEIVAYVESLEVIPPLPLAQAFLVENLQEEQPKNSLQEEIK
ncbi:uncharacterized protein LOC131176361 [Hevea brasiliensis]|uniref:uncharacterized protein LOC131176361 n=1 Tax=Hevea brasiliensis TaxID=3981 RepID=UPI0025EE1D57|nr:uncharacterized protein LOC131176361 [Hevea brasiliensis]